jgi:hypothetical protein
MKLEPYGTVRASTGLAAKAGKHGRLWSIMRIERMGHLDGRIEQHGNSAADPKAGAKDGPAGMKPDKTPSKDDITGQRRDKATDVVHGGDNHAKSRSKSGA